MDSILTSTKKTLGLAETYTAFDSDIVIFINSVFGVLHQLGVGPDEGFMIEDETSVWSEFVLLTNQLSLIKTYMYLRVRLLFDPPATSYLIEATKKQVEEYEWRISVNRENSLPPLVSPLLES